MEGRRGRDWDAGGNSDPSSSGGSRPRLDSATRSEGIGLSGRVSASLYASAFPTLTGTSLPGETAPFVDAAKTPQGGAAGQGQGHHTSAAEKSQSQRGKWDRDRDRDRMGRSDRDRGSRDRGENAERRGGRERPMPSSQSYDRPSEESVVQVQPTVLLAKRPSQRNALTHVESSVAPRAPVFSMTRAVSLVSDQYVFQSNELGRFLSDLPLDCIVGVIGEHGVGKSSVCNDIMQCGSDPVSFFPVETDDDLRRGAHRTPGILAALSMDGVLVLDSQPICSSSVSTAGGSSGSGSGAGVPGSSRGSFVPLWGVDAPSLSICLFLFSVCHVIVVVSDSLCDLQLFRYVQLIDCLRTEIPHVSDVNSPNLHGQSPELVFCFNRVPSAYFSRMEVDKISLTLDAYFLHARFGKLGDLTPLGSVRKYAEEREPPAESSWRMKEDLAADRLVGAENMPCCRPAVGNVSFFLIPEWEEEVDRESIEVLKRTFSDGIRQMRKPDWKRASSEKDWLRGAALVWERCIAPSSLAAYFRFLTFS